MLAMSFRDLLVDSLLALHDSLLRHLRLLTSRAHDLGALVLLRGSLMDVVTRMLQQPVLTLNMLDTILVQRKVVNIGLLNPHLLTLDATALAIRLGHPRKPSYPLQDVLLVGLRSLRRTPILVKVHLLDGRLARFEWR